MIDFFRINMPYGMVRNDKGEWCFFNREYTYLGSKDSGKIQDDSPFFCLYADITNEFLESLAEKDSIERTTKGKSQEFGFIMITLLSLVQKSTIIYGIFT